MDAVVLAGGRGSRLGELTPPFYKPLLPVDGVPLVRRATDHAWSANCGRVVVITAPENTLPISQVLDDDVYISVQSTPRGPGDALRIGLQVCTTDDVLVLLADNVMRDADVAMTVAKLGVSCKRYAPEVALRFTRWNASIERWVERVDVTEAQIDGDGLVTCWVGPMVVNRKRALIVLSEPLSAFTERLLGPVLSDIASNPKEHIDTSAYDVGTIDQWRTQTKDD